MKDDAGRMEEEVGETRADHRAACGLAARWVFPVAGPPIRNGVLRIEDGRSAAIEAASSNRDVEDLGNVAILPGLVNVHTHLDLSDSATPLGEPGIAFCDWIRRVIAFRRSRDDSVSAAAWNRGLDESLSLGTTMLGDIVQPGSCGPSTDSARLLPAVTAFLELIAPTPERTAAALDLAHHWVPLASRQCSSDTTGVSTVLAEGHWQDASGTQHWQDGSGTQHWQDASGTRLSFQSGLSPHAPYSVHPDLLTQVVRLSAEHGVPLAMHLAESREEMELLRTGGGPLRTLLEELGAWCPTLVAAPSRPLDYLRTLAAAHRALVIHGNYLDDEEIAFLATHRQTMSVVYCPRAHAFFGHAPYPLEKMLAAGAKVVLGTDSRASSPDLSVLAEMRAVARRHPTVSNEAILGMATLAGARALGRDAAAGSLEPGKSADVVAVALPDREVADPHELLLDSDLPVVAVWRRGARIAWG